MQARLLRYAKMKIRLDQLVVERGLASERDSARRLILAGKVLIEGRVADKPGRAVPSEAQVELRGPASRYVGRGGEKLEGALARFGLEIPSGCLALDVGVSTGGFTDCLLQRGAARVVAVDVGHGQIHERLRADPRVKLLERTNARGLTIESIGGEPVDVVTIDVSFISLTKILPAIESLIRPGGSVLALIKPQFEARRAQVGSGGVVRDRAVHREVLERILDFCSSRGWVIRGVTPSPLLGADGNLEFFLWLARPSGEERSTPLAHGKIDVERVLGEAYNPRSAERE